MIHFYQDGSKLIAVQDSVHGFTRVIVSEVGSETYTVHCDGRESVSYYPVPHYKVDAEFFKEWVCCLVDDVEAA